MIVAESMVHWDTTTASSIRRKKMQVEQANNLNIPLIWIYFQNKTAVIANTLIHYFKAVPPLTFPYTERVSKKCLFSECAN